MSWSVRPFLEQNGIDFNETGKSTKAGNLYIWCPFCADPDRKKRLLGIHLTTGKWGCWKNSGPVGRAPHRLIRALVGWSDQQIDEYLGTLSAPGGTIADLRKRLRAPWIDSPVEKVPEVSLPEGAKPPASGGLRDGFWRYLLRRGFRERDLPNLIRDWDLRCALTGPARGRLVIPLRWEGKLYGWTGRAIGKTDLRYYSFPEGDAVKRHPLCGPGIDEGGKVLVIVEGPFDAMKLDFYSRPFGVRAVALLGLNPTPAQALDLVGISSSFQRTRVLVDAGSGGSGLRLLSALSMLAPRLASLPEGIKDPGDLSRDGARSLARELLRS